MENDLKDEQDVISRRFFLGGLAGLFFALAPEFLQAREKICAFCHRPILKGSMYTLGQDFFHAACYEKTTLCKICQKPIINEMATVQGQERYHTSCYRKTLTCRICQQKIGSEGYVTVGEQAFHERCFHNTPRCSLCALPIADKKDLVQKWNQAYHQNCLKKTLQCSICQKPILDAYRQDLYGRPFCFAHKHETPCDICLYPEATFALSDGRNLCDRCGKNAIFDEESAREIFLQVLDTLTQQFHIEVDVPIAFHLLDRPALLQIEGSGSPSQLGKFVRRTTTIQFPFGILKKLKDEFDIYVLFGLPRPLFQAVIAHEITHVWQALYAVENQSEMLLEGTAELVSYLYLKRYDEQIWMSMIEQNQQQVYREGFERAYAIYQRQGLEEFLNFSKTNDRFR